VDGDASLGVGLLLEGIEVEERDVQRRRRSLLCGRMNVRINESYIKSPLESYIRSKRNDAGMRRGKEERTTKEKIDG